MVKENNRDNGDVKLFPKIIGIASLLKKEPSTLHRSENWPSPRSSLGLQILYYLTKFTTCVVGFRACSSAIRTICNQRHLLLSIWINDLEEASSRAPIGPPSLCQPIGVFPQIWWSKEQSLTRGQKVQSRREREIWYSFLQFREENEKPEIHFPSFERRKRNLKKGSPLSRRERKGFFFLRFREEKI